MKKLVITDSKKLTLAIAQALTCALILVAPVAFADEKLPSVDIDLIDTIRATHPNKDALIASFGTPAKEEEITEKSTGKVVANIVHFRKITKTETGEVYPVTEFDLMNGQIENVVFLGTDTLDAE